MEQFANNAQTTLSGAISSSATTLTVTSATAFPATGNFRIIVDSEIMLVTGVSGSTFTVTRGQEGTAASGHADLAVVAQVVTKGAMAAFRSDSVFWDTFANRPAAGGKGRLHVVEDDVTLAYDDGSNWRAFGPLQKFVSPVNDDFTWVNQGGATISLAQDGILINAPANSGDSFRIRKKAAPATPYTVSAFITYNVLAANFNEVGLCWRESATGEIVTFGMTFATNVKLNVTKWTSPTGTGTDYTSAQFVPTGFMKGAGWLRISDDGTNRRCWYSNDGKYWIRFHSVLRTDFLTADEVGFHISINHATVGGTMTLLSWKEGS